MSNIGSTSKRIRLRVLQEARFLLLLWALTFPLLCAAVEAASGKADGKKGVYLQTADPSTPTEHNNRGVELGSKGLWEDAIREHQRALDMDVNNKVWRTNLSAAHLGYGQSLLQQSKLDAAAAQFRKAMIVDPSNKTADFELDKVISLKQKDPNNYEYRKSLAEDADSKSDYDKAIVEWRKCIKLRDTQLDHANLGRSLIQSGKEVEGFSELKEAVGRSGWPDDQKIELSACHRDLAELLKKLASTAMRSGRTETGLKRLNNAAIEFKRAAILNSADGRAVQGLIDVLLQVVSIRSSFDNRLSLFFAYILAGDFLHARQELAFSKKLGPHREELADATMLFYDAVAKTPITLKEEFLKEILDEENAILAKEAQNAKLMLIVSLMYSKLGDPDKAKELSDKAQKLSTAEKEALP